MNPDALMMIALIGAHFYFDYAGQGDFMARAKNPDAPIPGVPWGQVLIAHACIHGTAVALITGLWGLFFLEAWIHAYTDTLKCAGRISFGTDQVIHIACKVLWFALAVWLS
jgi:hypothetical protein